MSHPIRIAYPGAWYHVMNRGRRAEIICFDELDYLEKNSPVSSIIGRMKTRIKISRKIKLRINKMEDEVRKS